jgi:hypothetical protein
MSAEEVVRTAMHNAYQYDANGADAIDILGALKAAGYAVVELPEAVGVNGQDNRVWLRAPHIEQEFNRDVVIADRLGFDVLELRTVAAALLAAAEAWEADNV